MENIDPNPKTSNHETYSKPLTNLKTDFNLIAIMVFYLNIVTTSKVFTAL